MVAWTLAASFTVTACGSDEESGRSAAPGNGTDRAFVAAMIPHHESAVKMAEVAEGRAEGDFVKQLASDILATQTDEIAEMREQDAELAEAGIKPGKLRVGEHMNMDDDPMALRNADPFDPAFVKMMIPHHESAVEMARAELDKGQDPELKKLADSIIATQQREIDQMLEQSNGGSRDEHGSGHG